MPANLSKEIKQYRNVKGHGRCSTEWIERASGLVSKDAAVENVSKYIAGIKAFMEAR